MEFTTVNDYLNKLHFATEYKNLTPEDQESIVFTAQEVLMDRYEEKKLTPRVIALQTLFMLEGENEEHSRLKRHGVSKFSTKGISVEYAGGNIAPDVVAILEPSKGKAAVARLI